MNGHSIGMFLHIGGAIGMFIALALEWVGLRQLRSAAVPEQVYAWMGILKNNQKVLFISMLITVLTGLFMTLTEWGFVAWIDVTLGAIVLMIVFGLTITAPRMAAIGKALITEKRPISQTFHNLVNQQLLWISIQTRVAMGLGILLLMIDKPHWIKSLLIIGIAIVLGLVSALPELRQQRTQEGVAD